MHTLDSFFAQYAEIQQHNDPDRIILSCAVIKTPLDPVVVIADDNALYFLEFINQPLLAKKMLKLAKATNASFSQDITAPIRLCEQELNAYFAGTLQQFTTPVKLIGTPFSVSVWQTLQKIPYGKTVSYAELATAVGKPTACRAVANANGMNFLPIIIPCHRVINTNGELGGYNSGVERKAWLLAHEQRC